jgi:hypothetical protein
MVCAVLIQVSGDRNSSTEWVQLSRLSLKTETESSLRNVVFLNKNRTIDNAQNIIVVLMYHHHRM